MRRCPPAQTLERLLAEQLADAERAGVEAHVEHCPECQAALDRLSSAGAGRAAPESLSASGGLIDAADPGQEAFFERLKRNTSTADPPGGAAAEPPQPRGYEILGELGRGAAGVVYRARQLSLDRLVALKVVVAGRHLSADARRRFHTEARATARLRHRNIIQVYDVGEHDGCPFLSLELVEGGSLADWAHGRPRPATEAAQVVATVARAVEFAHGQGVVHRDLKPGNVLLGVAPGRPTRREIKIADFGIAKELAPAGPIAAPVTQTGELLGTPAYMAPEQFRGQPGDVSAATDVYAIGVILYELLVGRPPFQGATAIDTLIQAANLEPVPPRLLVPRTPRDLDTVCLKCLEKSPAKRYATAAELADDLDRFRRGEPIRARPVWAPERAVRWGRRHKPLAAALGGVALLLVAVTAASLYSSHYFRAMERAQRDLADQRELERGHAVEAGRREADLRQQAEAVGQTLRRTLYFSQMILGAQAAASPGGIGRVRECLDPWRQGRSDPRNPDLRNWEWFYLDALCHRDLVTLTDPANGVRDVAWAPDGGRLAAAGADGAVRVWTTGDWRQVRVLVGGSMEFRRVTWSPDGLRLAATNLDGRTFVWDVDTGGLLATLPGGGRTTALGWSPDGRAIAVGGSDLTIRIWDAHTAKPLHTLHGTAAVLDVAWSPDGGRLAVGCEDFRVHVWELAGEREVLTLKGHENFVNRVVWKPDSGRLATASNDGTAKIWDATTGAGLLTLRGHGLGVSAIAYSPDGTRLATGSDDQTVRVWSADGGELLELRGHTDLVTSVAWSPDGRRLASGSVDQAVKIWDAAARSQTRSLAGQDGGVQAIAWSPDGRAMASGGTDQLVHVWDPVTGQQRLTLAGHGGQIRCVAWSPDGRRLASAGDDHAIRLWDATDGRPTKAIRVDADAIDALAWSPDGRQLASTAYDAAVRVWDAGTGAQVRAYVGHQAYACCVAWSPDGRRLASASADGTVRVWDAAAGRELLSFAGHAGEVFCVAWSADGTRLASGGRDQTVRVWDADRGVPLLTLRGHAARVTGVAWNPDGTRLASTGDDGTTKLWDTVSGQQAMSFETPDTKVRAAAWSPDGLTLATGGTGGAIALHDATAGYWLERAPQFVSMLDRRLGLDPGRTENLAMRAELRAIGGDWTAAAADLRAYLSAHPGRPWFTLGDWVAGPYPEDLATGYAPEADSDPSHTLAKAEGAGPPPQWVRRDVSGDPSGFVDFGRLFGHAEHVSGYALIKVYSPRKQDVAVLLGADDQVRLWVNGRLVYENLLIHDSVPDADAAAAVLVPGWNTLLARVVNVTGEHALYLRLSDAPGDLARAAAGVGRQRPGVPASSRGM